MLSHGYFYDKNSRLRKGRNRKIHSYGKPCRRIRKSWKKSYTNRGALICYGVLFYIFLHICVNLMGLLGMMPMTGVPLPFISYGGSFTLCLMVSIAFVQRVCIETRIREEEKNKKK